MNHSKHFCPEEDVSIGWLASLFEGAFLPIVDRQDNSLWVKAKLSTIQVLLAPEKRAISLVISYRADEDANLLQKVIEANNCNCSLGWARFYMMQTENMNRPRLVCDYTLSYERGVVPFHIIRTMELLELVAAKGVQKEFLKLPE